MAGPPHDPDGPLTPDEEPRGSDPGWIRPSQRRRRPPARDESASRPTPPEPDPTRREPIVRRPPPARDDHDPAPTGGRPEPPDEDRDAEETVAALAVPADAADAAGSSGTRAASRKQRRNRRRAVAAGVAIVAVLALVGGLVLTSGGGSAHAARIRLKVPHTVVAATSDTALIAT